MLTKMVNMHHSLDDDKSIYLLLFFNKDYIDSKS